MAKRKTPTKRAEKADRTALQVRLREDVREKLSSEAQAAGLSLNQLIEGILEANAWRIVQGEPYQPESFDPVVARRNVSHCVFFGTVGSVNWCFDAKDQVPEYFDPPKDIDVRFVGCSKLTEHRTVRERGAVWYVLDYSQRPVRYPEGGTS